MKVARVMHQNGIYGADALDKAVPCLIGIDVRRGARNESESAPAFRASSIGRRKAGSIILQSIAEPASSGYLGETVIAGEVHDFSGRQDGDKAVHLRRRILSAYIDKFQRIH